MHSHKAQNHCVPNGLKKRGKLEKKDKIKTKKEARVEVQSRVLDDVRREFCGEFHMYMRFHTSCRKRENKERGMSEFTLIGCFTRTNTFVNSFMPLGM